MEKRHLQNALEKQWEKQFVYCDMLEFCYNSNFCFVLMFVPQTGWSDSNPAWYECNSEAPGWMAHQSPVTVLCPYCGPVHHYHCAWTGPQCDLGQTNQNQNRAAGLMECEKLFLCITLWTYFRHDWLIMEFSMDLRYTFSEPLNITKPATGLLKCCRWLNANLPKPWY